MNTKKHKTLKRILANEQDMLSLAYADLLNETESGWSTHEALKSLVFMVQTKPDEFESLLPKLRAKAQSSYPGVALYDVQIV